MYIDEHGTVATGGDPAVRSGGEAPAVDDMLATIRRAEQTTPHAFGAGVAGVATRPSPAMPTPLYDSVDHPTLKAMVTEDVDPEQVGEIGQVWLESGTRLAQFADEVTAAVNGSRAGWQGAAGDAARQFIADVGSWIGQAGQGAQLAGNHAVRHAEALAAARNAMPEPVAFDVNQANAELRGITDPVQLLNRYAQHMATYTAQQSAQRRAAEVVTAYDTALSSAAAMPAFGPPPSMSGGAPAPVPARGPVSTPLPSTALPSTPLPSTPLPSAALPGGLPPLPRTEDAHGLAVSRGGTTSAPPATGGAAATAAADDEFTVQRDQVFGDEQVTAPPVIGG